MSGRTDGGGSSCRWFISCAVLCAGFTAGAPDAVGADAQALARKMLDTAGVRGGLVVHIGCGDGKLTAALRADDNYLVHGLDADPKNVADARRRIQAMGVYGKVSVARWRGDRLPYVDNLVNLIVADDLGGVAMQEVLRVLAPNGVAYVKRNGHWARTVKPRPETIDEWTHYMHDAGGNAVAHDSVVGPPRRLQWIGSPRWARHHDHMGSTSALVSTGGRIFYIFDEGPTASIVLPSKWSLIARDAFNGTILWKRPIDKWHVQLWPLKSGPALLPRRLVAVDDAVYVTLGLDAPLAALDAATGKTIWTCPGSDATEEIIASGGMLFAVLGDPTPSSSADTSAYPNMQMVRRGVGHERWGGGEKSILAVQADTGRVLWKKRHPAAPLTLASDGQRVFLHNREKVLCLDRKTGETLWTSEPLPVSSLTFSWFAPTLVVYDDVVLFAGGEKMIPHRGGEDTLTALSAKTGKKLWAAKHPPCGYQSPEDVLVADGLVWAGSTTSGSYDGVFQGLDPHTGEVKSQFPPDVETYWFHHRCYRSKATDRYLMPSRTGIEFLDVSKKHWIIHHWTRGACLYGIMPCNGLIYTPPHDCACYPESKQYGFSVLAAESKTARIPAEARQDARLEQGPAFGHVDHAGSASSGDDWPTYRHDAARSGATKTAVPAAVEPAWKADLGGKLSSLAIAGGKLFLAAVDTHTVHALDARSGKRLWSHTAGGRVDSPPTIWQGCVLFGSADGWVTCLRESDGELVWRFRGAPMDQRLTAFEQIESVWPVHGNVLVRDGVVSFVAGRSMFLDGGMRFLRLDAKTGRKLSETILDDRDPATGKDLQVNVKILNMPVALPDVLSSDGKHVFMRSQMFDLKGKRLALGPHSGDPAGQGSVQRGEGVHIFSPTGFLDGTWFHRSYWVCGRSFAGGHAGYHQAGKFAPSGRILASDGSRVYGFARKPKYYRWTTPLEYHLFASDREPPKVEGRVGKANKGSLVRVEKSESLNPTGKPLTVEAWVKAEKPAGVVLARGGPSHGYALIVKKGKPRFVVRVDEKVCAVAAKQKVVGKWVHLAGVLTQDKALQIYVNGKLSGSAKAEGFIANDPHQAMEIGADDAGGVGDYKSPFSLTGIVDEVRVYHRALSAEEIRKHHDAPGDAVAKDAALVLCYSFDKGKAADGSGKGNNGKIEGVKPVPGKVGKALRFTGKMKSASRHQVKFHWSEDLPLFVRAMVLAGDTLFIAGPPDMVDEEQVLQSLNDPKTRSALAEQAAALDGRKGALLWAVSAADGKKLAACKLESPPVWDGMAAAGGRLYVSTVDGKVLCMAGK